MTQDHLPDAFRVAILGGGISGLSAAWALERAATEQGIPLYCTVLEQSGHWGGKVKSDQVDYAPGQSYTLEYGPDCMLVHKPWGLKLARQLGLSSQLINTRDAKQKTYVLNKGRMTPLPEGVMLTAPTKLLPFLKTSLFSVWGKLRMGLDFIMPASQSDDDESLAQFVRRRLGNEALNKLAEPLMSGIYNADAEHQSLLATFPRLRALEREHGSLIRGLLAGGPKKPKSSPAGASAGSSATTSFVSFKNGMHTLIDALVDALDSDLIAHYSVERITHNADQTYTIYGTDRAPIHADAVILTTPAPMNAQLVEPIAPEAAQLLREIRYVSTGTLSVAYRRESITRLPEGYGVVIPRTENSVMNAVTILSQKFDHRAPDGSVLMRAFFGGSRRPYTMDWDDDKLLAEVTSELQKLFGIQGEPLFTRIYRAYNANPQYDVGHLDHVDRIDAALPKGCYMTGSAFRGVGVPDCVHQAELTVNRLLETHTDQLKNLTDKSPIGVL